MTQAAGDGAHVHGRVLAVWWLACALWSSSFLLIRIGLADVGPFTFAASRLLVATVILVPLVVARGQARSVAAGDLAHVAGAGVLLLGANYGLVYWGAQHIPSGLVAILLAATPVVALTLGAILRAEVVTLRKVVAVASGFLGVVLIFGTEARASGPLALRGALAVGSASVCVAMAYVWVKGRTAYVPPLVLAMVQSAAGLVPLAVFALILEGNPLAMPWTLRSAGALLYLGGCASVFAFWLNYWLLARMDTSAMLMMGVAQVPIAIVLGSLVLGERLPPGTLLGAACILGGVLLGPARGQRASTSFRRS